MQNKSGIIRATGIVALIFIVVTIAWYLLSEFAAVWVSSDPQRAAVDLQAIADSPMQYLGFMGVDILYNLGIFVLGAGFYLIFRPYKPSLALIGGLGFITTGAMWLLLDMPSFTQFQLALDYSASSGATTLYIAERAASLSLWGDYSQAIVATLLSLGLFSFGILIIRNIAVSRLLGWLAVIAGILMLASMANTFEGSLISRIAYNVTEFWILVMGIWLLVRGVKTSGGEPTKTAI